MSRFKRLDKLQREDKALAAAAKRNRKNIIHECIRLFGLHRIPKQTNQYLLSIARLLDADGREQELGRLVNEWLRFEPKSARLIATEKPKHFFYYIRERQLSQHDLVAFYAYQMLALDYLKDPPEARQFRGLGNAIMNRLRDWLGEDGGNDLEEVLIDYLRAAFKTAARFNVQVIRNPDTIFGDFGWKAWLEWVGTEYGSRNGYLLPTQDEIEMVMKKRSLYFKFAQVRAGVLEEGNLALFDELGERSVEGDDEIRAIIEEYSDADTDHVE